MPKNDSPKNNPIRESRVLLWDMAGTLLPFDPISGKVSALPGSEEFLPELGKDFRLLVTTGDDTASARSLLTSFELLGHFEMVFGNLFTPMGKPYGEILRKTGGQGPYSLAIGDRFRADLPADTDQVVTIMVNQDHEVIHAGMISFLISILQKNGETFPEAFRNLSEKAEAAPEQLGPLHGGQVTAAWTCHTGFQFRMLEFQHALLDGKRLVIIF